MAAKMRERGAVAERAEVRFHPARFLDGAQQTVAGIVHEHVDAAEPFHGVGDRLAQGAPRRALARAA
jgi:hypothetical protein